MMVYEICMFQRIIVKDCTFYKKSSDFHLSNLKNFFLQSCTIYQGTLVYQCTCMNEAYLAIISFSLQVVIDNRDKTGDILIDSLQVASLEHPSFTILQTDALSKLFVTSLQ